MAKGTGRPTKAVKVKRLLESEPKRAAKLLTAVYTQEHFVRDRIARRVGCAAQTLQRWERKYPELGTAIAKAQELWLRDIEEL
jgi:hypothetical protein